MGDRSTEELEAALGVRNPVHADERVNGPADEAPVGSGADPDVRRDPETLR